MRQLRVGGPFTSRLKKFRKMAPAQSLPGIAEHQSRKSKVERAMSWPSSTVSAEAEA